MQISIFFNPFSINKIKNKIKTKYLLKEKRKLKQKIGKNKISKNMHNSIFNLFSINKNHKRKY